MPPEADPADSPENPTVCLCFHVPQRKIVTYCKREKPPVASLISECLSAGTGCGWCIPFLKSLHQQCKDGVEKPTLGIDPEDYANKRANYRKQSKRHED